MELFAKRHRLHLGQVSVRILPCRLPCRLQRGPPSRSSVRWPTERLHPAQAEVETRRFKALGRAATPRRPFMETLATDRGRDEAVEVLRGRFWPRAVSGD